MLKQQNLFLFFILVTSTIFSNGCSSRIYSPEGSTTTVVLIRHAERTIITKELTDAGIARAESLPAALKDLNIAAIYSPNLSRNINTVMPLAKDLNLEIILVDAKPDVTEVARRLLHDFPGKTVLWVGNTSNLDRIYPDLGGSGTPPIEYGDLFILHIPDKGFTQTVKRHFGD